MTELVKDRGKETSATAADALAHTAERITPEEIARLRRFLAEWRGASAGIHPLLSSRMPFISSVGMLQAVLLGALCEFLSPGSFLLVCTVASAAYVFSAGTVLALRIQRMKRQLAKILPVAQEQTSPVAFKATTIQNSLTAVTAEPARKPQGTRGMAELAFHTMDTNTAPTH